MEPKMIVFSETNDLKSLPLSLSGVILGIMLAVADYNVNWMAASALVLSAVLIHMYMASESR